jgi:hypothetical protein
MFQFLCSILLIASLLTCPSRCNSCQSDVASVDVRVPAGCSCCHGDITLPVSDSRDNCPPAGAPRNDCTCPNCICEGATLQDGLKLPNSNTQPLCFCQWSAEIERDISVAIVLEFARETQDCNRYHSGRDARIAHHSWLN